MPRRERVGRVGAALLFVALVGGCGSESDDSTLGSPVETIAPATSTTTTSPRSTTSTTSSAPASSVATTGPGTTAPEVRSDTIELPTGDVAVGPDDLFILHSDGDLWLHPGILGAGAGDPVRLADFDDPRIPVVEGPGPNTVDDVAGAVNGVVYYADCCEPVSGTLLAATGEDSALLGLSSGYGPVLSPDRTKLATMGFELSVIDLTTGASVSRSLNDTEPTVNPWDLIWSPDGMSLVMLYFEDSRFQLASFSAEPPFQRGDPISLGVVFDSTSGSYVQFAGRGPHGEIAVAVGERESTLIRYFDGTTLTEIPEMQGNLPAGVTSVRLAGDGTSLMWIEGSALWYWPANGEAHQLGSDFTAAWFAA